MYYLFALWITLLQVFPPTPNQLVNDYTQTLSQQEINTLENKLLAYEDSSSIQIAVVIIEETGGYPIAEYATALGRDWGIGNKQNQGVLILMSKQDKKVFIATGYGTEGGIPDITAKRIIENYFLPFAKRGNFYEAFAQTIIAVQKSLQGEAIQEKPKDSNKKPKSIIGIIIFLGIVFLFIRIFSKRNNGGGNNHGGGLWMAAPLILGSGRGFGSGGGSFGGGGGFGGFGGGSFGGGGAGGSW